MTVAHPPQGRQAGHPGGAAWSFTEWTLGIIGGIATFLGLFVLLASDDASIGIGGEWSWEVGDIAPGWGWAMLIGGSLFLLVAIVMVVVGRDGVEEVEAENSALRSLLWHSGIFLAVNAFIWIQDVAIGGGVDYAYLVTIPWGIGLAFHAGMYLVDPDRRA